MEGREAKSSSLILPFLALCSRENIYLNHWNFLKTNKFHRRRSLSKYKWRYWGQRKHKDTRLDCWAMVIKRQKNKREQWNFWASCYLLKNSTCGWVNWPWFSGEPSQGSMLCTQCCVRRGATERLFLLMWISEAQRSWFCPNNVPVYINSSQTFQLLRLGSFGAILGFQKQFTRGKKGEVQCRYSDAQVTEDTLNKHGR